MTSALTILCGGMEMTCHRLGGSSCTVHSAYGIGFEDALDLIAHAAEDGHYLLIGAGGMSGIIETPMVAVELTGEHGAGLIGIAADGDDGLDVLVQELVHVLAGVRADVDANLCHGFDAERVDVACGLGAGAGDDVAVIERGAEDAFGEMGAAGVAGAEDEDGRFVHGLCRMKDQRRRRL
jgi:hypothetical protein